MLSYMESKKLKFHQMMLLNHKRLWQNLIGLSLWEIAKISWEFPYSRYRSDSARELGKLHCLSALRIILFSWLCENQKPEKKFLLAFLGTLEPEYAKLMIQESHKNRLKEDDIKKSWSNLNNSATAFRDKVG